MKFTKLIIIATIVLFLDISCINKETKIKLNQIDVKNVDVSSYNKYEGKILRGSNNQWYLIKDGKRWRTNSIPASRDYLKSLPFGVNGQINEVIPIQIIEKYDEVGELYPNVIFIKDEKNNNL